MDIRTLIERHSDSVCVCAYRLLLERGDRFGSRDDGTGKHAIHVAVTDADADVVKLLIEFGDGGGVNARNTKMKMKPADLVMVERPTDLAMARCLTEAGATHSACGESGLRDRHAASRGGNIFDLACEKGWTAVVEIFAASNERPPPLIVCTLLDWETHVPAVSFKFSQHYISCGLRGGGLALMSRGVCWPPAPAVTLPS